MKELAENLYRRFRSNMLNGLLPTENGCIVVALSGGLDSVCLIHFMKHLSQEIPFRLSAHHQQHHIRGEEALRDQQFCEDLCRSLGIELLVSEADIPTLARQTKMNLEDTARNIRYENWRKIAEVMSKQGIDCLVATAHHADDVAETLLLHLERGSGLHGLGGIEPARDCFIRPLLDFTKSELAETAKVSGWNWIEDSSNQDTDYSRNFLRNEILPAWQMKADPGLAKRLGNTAELVREHLKWFDSWLNTSINNLQKWPDEFFLPDKYDYFSTDSFQTMDPAIRSDVLRRIWSKQKPLKDLLGIHLAAMEKAICETHGEKRLSLPMDCILVRTNRYFWLEDSNDVYDSILALATADDCPTRLPVVERKTCIPNTNWVVLYPDTFESNKTNFCLRTYLAGDWYRDREGKKKPLKIWFQENGFPLRYRKQVWLLANGQEILQISGRKPCETKHYETVNLSAEAVNTTVDPLPIWYNFALSHSQEYL